MIYEWFVLLFSVAYVLEYGAIVETCTGDSK